VQVVISLDDGYDRVGAFMVTNQSTNVSTVSRSTPSRSIVSNLMTNQSINILQ